MEFAQKKFELKDGTKVIFRNAQINEAEKILLGLKQRCGETTYLARYPDECDKSVEQEEEFLKTALESDDRAYICIEVNGEIAGDCGLTFDGRDKMRHVAHLGIAIKKAYWGLGIGSRVMEMAKEICRSKNCELLVLTCFAKNERALGLYKKCGFVEYGRCPNFFKLRDGSYDDEVSLYCKL